MEEEDIGETEQVTRDWQLSKEISGLRT